MLPGEWFGHRTAPASQLGTPPNPPAQPKSATSLKSLHRACAIVYHNSQLCRGGSDHGSLSVDTLCVLCLAAPLFAQTSTGTIVGSVTDPSGAAALQFRRSPCDISPQARSAKSSAMNAASSVLRFSASAIIPSDRNGSGLQDESCQSDHRPSGPDGRHSYPARHRHGR